MANKGTAFRSLLTLRMGNNKNISLLLSLTLLSLLLLCCHSISCLNLKNKNIKQSMGNIFKKKNDIPPFQISSSVYITQTKMETNGGISGTLQLMKGTNGPFGNDITNLKYTITFETNEILHLLITDIEGKRWQASPFVLKDNNNNNKKKNKKIDNDILYHIEVSSVGQPFYFTIYRKEGIIFSTKNRPFVFSDQYITFGTEFYTNNNEEPNIYGLGERIDSLRLNITDNKFSMWNNDNGNDVQTNLYGTHPFYLQASNSQPSHGVFFLNTNAMDVRTKYNNQDRYLQFETIGGVMDLYFFLGPTSKQVIEQYHSIIGKPYLPPYWSLGFHQCRWGYNTLDEVKQVVSNYSLNNLPLDAMWTDIDYMYLYWDFTFDSQRYPINNVRNFVKDLHQNGMKYVVIVDPGIPTVDLSKYSYEPLELGLQLDIFVKNATGNGLAWSTVWPGPCYFPDATHPKYETSYWKPLIHSFLASVQVDGLWIDMNELATFLAEKLDDKYNSPPYNPTNDYLYHKTLPLNSNMYISNYYNAHTLYPYFEAKVTAEALQTYYGKRSFVLTRSSFSGSGKYVSHWTGDNFSTYESMRSSISSILLHNMFGFAHVGSDIGGFNGDCNEELLIRWMQLGSMYPFSRNHNAINQRSQEPYQFSQRATDISRKVLLNRYQILPYLYTLLAKVNMDGGVAIQPLFFEYPAEKPTYRIETQYLMGKYLLVSPVLEQGVTMLTAYFPNDIWYDYYSGKLMPITQSFVLIDAPIDVLPLHLRGGAIIPRQEPALNTVKQKGNPYELLIALNNSKQAYGELFLDDGESMNTIEEGKYTLLNYRVSSVNNQIVIQEGVQSSGFVVNNLVMDRVIVYLGVLQQVNICGVQINGKPAFNNFSFNTSYLVLTIERMNLQMGSKWNIQITTC